MGEEDNKKENKKEEETAQEIVLGVFMHCEGCARKIRRWLKNFPGVEDVITDCKSSKVVVKGEPDPLKVLERIQRKSHRKVELLSPPLPKSAIEGNFEVEKKVIVDVEIQKPKPEKVIVDEVIQKPKPQKVMVDEEIQKPKPQKVMVDEEIQKPKAQKVMVGEEIQKHKPQVKKTEEVQQDLNPKVITVMLRVFMHCEACAGELKKQIMRMKGVVSVEPNVQASQVKVIGDFDPSKLTEYVYKKSGKLAVVIKQEPENKEEKENNGNVKEEKNGEDSAKKIKIDDSNGVDNGEKMNGGGGGRDEGTRVENDEDNNVVEMKRNEYNYYPVNYSTEYYAYPPSDHIFSDENPDACSIM